MNYLLPSVGLVLVVFRVVGTKLVTALGNGAGHVMALHQKVGASLLDSLNKPAGDFSCSVSFSEHDTRLNT